MPWDLYAQITAVRSAWLVEAMQVHNILAHVQLVSLPFTSAICSQHVTILECCRYSTSVKFNLEADLKGSEQLARSKSENEATTGHHLKTSNSN